MNPKVNDPTILEFMAMFSAWIRLPDDQVLRCGSLQNKSYKCEENKITEFLYIWHWGQGFGGNPEYWHQNGAIPDALSHLLSEKIHSNS